MPTDLDKFIEERFAHCRRSKGIQAVSDENDNVVFDDDLYELYRMGQRSRDMEVFKLNTVLEIQNKQLNHPFRSAFSLPWWIGVLWFLTWSTYCYFTYVR